MSDNKLTSLEVHVLEWHLKWPDKISRVKFIHFIVYNCSNLVTQRITLTYMSTLCVQHGHVYVQLIVYIMWWLCVYCVNIYVTCDCGFLSSGYTVTSVVSARNGRLLVAGAPRFNHTGKVIIFTLKNSGNLTILHSLKGQQVLHLLDKQFISCRRVALWCCPHVFCGRMP